MLCDLQIFLGKVSHPEPPHAQSLFLFPIVFGINLMIWLSRYSAIFRSASYTSDWFEPGLQVPGFSRHLASWHLSRNTIFICLKQSKLFQIIQHFCTTTCCTHVFQMFRALKTVLGNARLQEVWHFRHEQKICRTL